MRELKVKDMDALSLDQMLPEYQEAREEFVQEVAELHTDPTPSSPVPDDTASFNRDLTTDTTVPVCDQEPDLPDPGLAVRADNNPPASMDSTTSSTSSSTGDYPRHSGGSTSLYQPGFTAPSITYERDNDEQKLVAVIGREFDCPHDISMAFQRLVAQQPNCDLPVAKFVPFTLKRKMLIRGSFNNQELTKHDLICMCYNASEARLLLTGVDGFYTSLIKYVEASLGTALSVCACVHVCVFGGQYCVCVCDVEASLHVSMSCCSTFFTLNYCH